MNLTVEEKTQLLSLINGVRHNCEEKINNLINRTFASGVSLSLGKAQDFSASIRDLTRESLVLESILEKARKL